jgi:hypothetical protein
LVAQPRSHIDWLPVHCRRSSPRFARGGKPSLLSTVRDAHPACRRLCAASVWFSASISMTACIFCRLHFPLAVADLICDQSFAASSSSPPALEFPPNSPVPLFTFSGRVFGLPPTTGCGRYPLQTRNSHVCAERLNRRVAKTVR